MAKENLRNGIHIANQSNPNHIDSINSYINEEPQKTHCERAQDILEMGYGFKEKNESIYPNLGKSIIPINTNKELAKKAGISHGNLYKVEKIVQTAPPEMKEKLRQGEMSINEACKVNSFFLSLSIYKLLFNS